MGGGVLIRAEGSDFSSKNIKRGGTSIRDLRVCISHVPAVFCIKRVLTNVAKFTENT